VNVPGERILQKVLARSVQALGFRDCGPARKPPRQLVDLLVPFTFAWS